MGQTFAWIIGVNQIDLIGARADALKVARALFLYGIEKESIKVMLDEEATIQAVQCYFQELKNTMKENDRLFVYFAGHGSNDQGSTLHLYQEKLPLNCLIQSVSELPCYAFMVFDACSMQLDRVDLEPKTRKILGLSLLFPGDNSSTYEDRQTGSGEFTHIFLAALAKTPPKKELLLGHLIENINSLCIENGLESPIFFQHGRQNPLFLAPFIEGYVKEDLVQRTFLLKQLQDHFSKHLAPIIWIWGPAGHGKSTLAKQICSGPTTSVYTTVLKNNGDVLHSLFSQVLPQLPHIYPEGALTHSCAIEAFFSLKRKEPSLVWIIDHLERLTPADLLELIKIIAKIDFHIILISRLPPASHILKEGNGRIFDWQPSKLSILETELMIKLSSKTPYDAMPLHLSCDGNPLRLRQVLAHLEHQSIKNHSNNEAFKRTLGALYVIGPFLDEQLVCEVCSINQETMKRLHKMGLIGFCNNIFYPHDILFEIVENEQLHLDFNLASKYWALQVEKSPKNIHAARSLFFTVSHLEIDEIPLNSLLIALVTLRRKENKKLLIDLAESLTKREVLKELIIPLTHDLIDVEAFETAEKLIALIMEADPLTAKLLSAEILWWKGEFHPSIELSSSVLDSTSEPHLLVYAHANMGLAHFFLGNWDESKMHLEIILDVETVVTFKGWAECILGTILALRGENIPRGYELLLKSIKSFEQCDNFNWLSASWNNLGEVFWKIGKYHQALEALQKSREIVEVTKNLSVHMETLRNMVQVFLRMDGPSSLKVCQLMDEIIMLAKNANGTLEKMQYLNTFATVYAYKQDLDSLETTLNELFPLTENNQEYHIYTLANFALYHGLRREIKKAQEYLDKAVSLSLQGQNYLAIRQIQEDVQNCSLPLILSDIENTVSLSLHA